jgi:hypothetical protein
MAEEAEIDAGFPDIRAAQRADDDQILAARLFQRADQMAELAEPHPVMRKVLDARIGKAAEAHHMHPAALGGRFLADGDRHGSAASDDAQAWLMRLR